MGDDGGIAGANLLAIACALAPTPGERRPGVHRCEDRTRRRRAKVKKAKRNNQKAGRKAARKGKR